MLNALNEAGVEYLVVGAYALSVYGPARATGDFDIWVRASEENSRRVWAALEKFGAPRRKLTRQDLQQPDNVFQIGVAPNRIDILTSITGVDFDEAWQHREQKQINGISVMVIGREQLLKNKRATGRPKDLADVAWLEELGGRQ
jgi:hypothetical protein